MDWTLLIPIGAGFCRNIAGWAENSFKDGKIQSYEVGLLVSTVIEVAVLSLGALYGLGLDAASASGVGVLGSYLLSALKKK